ncbi:MAG: alpha/beta fold hydrolase [Pseudomonadota bacterium]
MQPIKRYWQPRQWISLLLYCAGTLLMAEDGMARETVQRGGDSTLVSVLYATLRNHENGNKPAHYYGDSRGRLSMGVCNMEFKAINGLKKLADSAPFYIPDRIRSLEGIEEYSAEEFWKSLDASVARNGGRLVFYIHGYNISFEKACKRAATFQRELGLHDRMLLFSWPANGNLLTYAQDEADLAWSAHHLEQFLAQLFDRFGASHIDLVAHSLGARGVLLALSRMGLRDPARQLFNELVLIAPDVDSEMFLQQLPRLRPLARRITLYASDNDRALKLSHEVHGSPRLGEAGKQLTLDTRIETIDVSALNAGTLSGHIYHQHNHQVIADIKELIDGGKGASHRRGLERKYRNGISYWMLNPEDHSP